MFTVTLFLSRLNTKPPSLLEAAITPCSELVATGKPCLELTIPAIESLIRADLLSDGGRLLFVFTEGVSLVPLCDTGKALSL